MENNNNNNTITISWMPTRKGGGLLCPCPGGVIYMDPDGTFCWSGEVLPNAVTSLYGALESIWENSGKPRSREITADCLPFPETPEEEEGEKAIIALLKGWRRRIETAGS